MRPAHGWLSAGRTITLNCLRPVYNPLLKGRRDDVGAAATVRRFSSTADREKSDQRAEV
jgi:hypothetical protein